MTGNRDLSIKIRRRAIAVLTINAVIGVLPSITKSQTSGTSPLAPESPSKDRTWHVLTLAFFSHTMQAQKVPCVGCAVTCVLVEGSSS